MTTLRDIITQNRDTLWRDNAGTVWNVDSIIDSWGSDLDHVAGCVEGSVRYLDASGYMVPGEAILTALPTVAQVFASDPEAGWQDREGTPLYAAELLGMWPDVDAASALLDGDDMRISLDDFDIVWFRRTG